MISSWKLHRFKSVYDDTVLEFAPLTLFCGINNSGKSTVIQSVLLVSQTLADPMRKRAVSLNGSLVRLGTFDDIVTNGCESDAIGIGFELAALHPLDLRHTVGPNTSSYTYRWSMLGDVTRIRASFTFSARAADQNDRKELVQLQPILDSTSLHITYKTDEGTERDGGGFIFARPTAAREDKPQLAFQEIGLRVKATPSNLSSPHYPYLSKGEIVSPYLNHFLPSATLATYDHVEEESRQIVNAFVGRPEYSHLHGQIPDSPLRIPDSFKSYICRLCESLAQDHDRPSLFRERVEARLKKLQADFTPQNLRQFQSTLSSSSRVQLTQKLAESESMLVSLARGGRQQEIRVRYQDLPPRFDFAADYISTYFQSCVKYLAPLRDEPKPVYPLAASSDPSNIGLHGEHSAAVLELNKSEIVDYIPSSSFDREGSAGVPTQVPLYNAVLDWMRYMGVATDIDTHDLGNRGHELKVATEHGSQLRDLTHVGVGVSQVLPIIVLCLLSPAGSLLVFEQPELHLHPRVQSRLADFFLSMTSLGKQCIVETHSEHLINRLRQRSALAPGDEVSSKVMVYFVEAEEGRSHYQRINIGPYGTIQNWPKGFFDEGEGVATAILRAGMEKRRRESR